ncbi:helix-turn-helix domain-containing protein [Streptomyces sp. NPDC032940]|uniref:helix-turn-helix domain-containing protein n=1 Tax=Streptomyces sp. NPDC032940 TaxID=3155366 RepID=UPI0034052A6B
MAHPQGKYADFEGLRERAVALRRAGYSLRQISDELGVRNKETLQRLVEGEPPPEWTKRPRAKDDLRQRARELRLQGWTYNQIQTELGCSKSSVSLWVRDLPTPEHQRRPDTTMARRGVQRAVEKRTAAREELTNNAYAEIGSITQRELFLVGVGLYWSEGAKAKPGAHRRVIFVNSDPTMIRVFLAWLDLLGVAAEHRRFSVNIHESADIPGAEAYWAQCVGIEVGDLLKTSLKKHNPKTNRTNTGESYHGCLRVAVLQSADLHRRIEGWWYGIVEAAPAADLENRT